MQELVSYERQGGVAVLTLDDGKANVLSPAMIAAINRALDRAEAERAVVLLTGRPGIFSGGFDLKILNAGGLTALRMLRGGFELAARMLSFPCPIVLASNGHAMAMGSFLLLSADYRVGASGPFTIQANEVAIGFTVPRAAVEICRQRLAPAHFVRATLLSESFAPDDAVSAGFLDRVVQPEALQTVALEQAQSLAALDLQAHARTKLRVRAEALRAIRSGLSADMRELVVLGAKRMVEARFGRR